MWNYHYLSVFSWFSEALSLRRSHMNQLPQKCAKVAATGEEVLEYLQQRATGQYISTSYIFKWRSWVDCRSKRKATGCIYIRVKIVIKCFLLRLNQSNNYLIHTIMFMTTNEFTFLKYLTHHGWNFVVLNFNNSVW